MEWNWAIFKLEYACLLDALWKTYNERVHLMCLLKAFQNQLIIVITIIIHVIQLYTTISGLEITDGIDGFCYRLIGKSRPLMPSKYYKFIFVFRSIFSWFPLSDRRNQLKIDRNTLSIDIKRMFGSFSGSVDSVWPTRLQLKANTRLAP